MAVEVDTGSAAVEQFVAALTTLKAMHAVRPHANLADVHGMVAGLLNNFLCSVAR